MSNNELRHFKYVKRWKKNGKWFYEYDNKLESHKGALANYEKNGAKLSRNMPGGNTDSNGKSFNENPNRMSLPQITAAKKHGAAVKKKQAEEQAHKDTQKLRAHAYTLDYKQRQNSVSRNIPSENKTTSKPANTLTKNDIRKALFKSKVNVLKREAKQAIDRAKKWLGDLFD